MSNGSALGGAAAALRGRGGEVCGAAGAKAAAGGPGEVLKPRGRFFGAGVEGDAPFLLGGVYPMFFFPPFFFPGWF